MSLSLYRNGSIYTPADPQATAMLVEDGTVAWIGSESAAGALADSRMDVIDLGGGLVTPAFFDSHVHLGELGAALESVDLRNATTLAQVLERVAAAASRGDGPIFGAGWDESGWPERRAPFASELQAAAGGRDVYLTRIDVHSGVVNEGLAERLKLDSVDGYRGRGLVERTAHQVVREALIDNSAKTGAKHQEAALRHLASRGYGAVAEMAAPQISGRADLEALFNTVDSVGDELPQVFAYWGEAVSNAAEARALFSSFGAGRLSGLAGDLNIDGSLGSRTALLRAPYTDASGMFGHSFMDAEAIAGHLAACSEVGIQGGFHVIGDAALDAFITGLDLAAERVGLAAIQGARHRLEHVEMADDAARTALLKYGITASMQPLFDAYWGGADGLYAQRLGSERATGMNSVARFLASGIPVTLGSDAPVTESSPWATVKACLEHHDQASRISARAAFLAHTRSGYRAVGESTPFAGQLVTGSDATFAIWQASELIVQTPDVRVSSWSTDARAGTPMLPVLEGELPSCLRTVRQGRILFDAL
ncbi:amidohydrolase [Paeniglutamicibacter cryotolerans]|uniref:Amidohydrolase 3 domain-containing protein n=1 Tax=Paeniglutamicibacter cryotolerans TaxID=670079 RepID=A0A839QLE1_9MICC|nr:amidohydrolase family protein [Paeniglutamicibacter cryotolerans]MBB2997238.1 hypothetical protein [Paeniglutamicibacter cryotolerans]